MKIDAHVSDLQKSKLLRPKKLESLSMATVVGKQELKAEKLLILSGKAILNKVEAQFTFSKYKNYHSILLTLIQMALSDLE